MSHRGTPGSHQRKQIEKTRLLLGEGQDEERFLRAMLRHLGRSDVQVMSTGGKTGLRAFLRALLDDPLWPKLESLLLIRDADFGGDASRESASVSALRSLSFLLGELGLPVPPRHGTFVSAPTARTEGPLRVGVFVLPDGTSEGMLEDLCLAAVTGDAMMPCLEAYLRCIDERRALVGSAPIARNQLPKARVHAFLASRPEPDRRVGEAAEAGIWPWEADALRPLVDFVNAA